MTKTTSGFGMQYDSLADLVAFGVAPGIMIYLWALKDLKQFGWVAAFLFVVCGALRLARFNVQQGSFDPRYFNGLPIPAAATMIATSIAVLLRDRANGFPGRHVSSGDDVRSVVPHGEQCQVCKLQKNGTFSAAPFHTLVAVVSIFVVVATAPDIMGFLLMAAYVASGPISTFMYHRREALAPKGESETPPPKLTGSQGFDLGGGGEA